MRLAAQSRSASGSTTAAPFPPSSSVTCLRGAWSLIAQPTGTEPVKDTIGRRGSSTRAGARSFGTGRIENIPAGRSVSASISPSSSADSGVAGAGEDDRRARRDRRGDLVGGEVQREVERRDAEHRALGHAGDVGHPALGGRVGVEPLRGGAEAAGLLGGEPERGDRAGHLAARPQQRLAVLRGDQPGDLLGPLGDPRGHVRERLRPPVQGQRGGLPAGASAAAIASSTCAGVGTAAVPTTRPS